MPRFMNTFALTAAAISLCAGAATANAQAHVPSKVDIAFNRYYDYNQLVALQQQLADAYPELVTLEQIGESRHGLPMHVAIINNEATGAHDSKPAMWIDGNVHGNEIQGAEYVLYTLWYLTKGFGEIADITELFDQYSFYLLLSQNPDGRQYWFDHANTPSSSRQNHRPVDNDSDGLFDEDPSDDLDGDGSITTMWKRTPGKGDWNRDKDDQRVFNRVGQNETGDWTRIGSEGIDNDDDGRINEDPPGGDDMNRDWPSDWQPVYVQSGAAPHPLHNPETHAIATFILAHPNIAAVQSYHNSGGMILRGPAASYVDGFYPQGDIRVLDEIGRVGEKLLPYYRYMIIYADLYTVHGGFVNWTNEGLGIYSFTNELWTGGKIFQGAGGRASAEDMQLYRDRLRFGQDFKDYEAYDHPQHGEVLIGGLNKWASRNTPTFMLEEEAHRNFGFTMYHADSMPVVEFGDIEVERMRGDLWAVTVEVKNEKLMPTRSGIARQNGIGRNDLLVCEPDSGRGASVVLSGSLASWQSETMTAVRDEPGRVQLAGGVPGRGRVLHRFIVSAREGQSLRLAYRAEKAKDIETTVTLR